ncbi:MAG: hypothetical protein LKJ74_05190 [Clostridiales bacterium]|nr:hypothetical protein [Clostridiales bacterium]MCI2161745.1 hypothetical protein [Oscillospiraceae bacterium]MCI2191711.1 hypothetical protein [Oscillospiraceae bacterium]MCI2205678.1 hypothetical protein [Oscillospiraceae bacterium]
MRKNYKDSPHIVPPDSPNGRAKTLNQLARQEFPDLSELSENEQKYVTAVHDILQRYQHHEICADQAKAERQLLQISCLQEGLML